MLHRTSPAYSQRLHQTEMTGPLRTVEDIHSPLETFFPPSLLTMHYLVTEASQALLSVPWWMVLGAPQWPQWLASADKALNGFSGNLIAPQSPKDTTRLQLPLQSPIAAEIETEPACLFFPQDWPLTLSSSFWRKSTAKARKRCKKKTHKRTAEAITEAIKVSRSYWSDLPLLLSQRESGTSTYNKVHNLPFSNPYRTLPSVYSVGFLTRLN